MIEQTFQDIYSESLAVDAIINNAHPGFREDYLTLHCLLRKYQPKRFMEIGSSEGLGTMIIKNALGEDSVVYSLELPTELCHPTLQIPRKGPGSDSAGYMCTLPYIQLRGDSMTYDYTQHYPLDGWWVDGDHSFESVFHDANQALNSGARLIVFHDCDGEPVLRGILEAKKSNPNGEKYEFCRVVGTRIGYLLLK